MGRFVRSTDQLENYLSRVGGREHPAQTRCREETQKMGRVAGMQIAPEQGAFFFRQPLVAPVDHPAQRLVMG